MHYPFLVSYNGGLLRLRVAALLHLFDNWLIRETKRQKSFICSVAQAFLQLFHRLVNGERRRPLAGGEVLERLEELAGQRAAREQDVALLQFPTVVGVGGDVGLLIGVGVQIVHLREPQRREW